jgi:hypothetical protein
MHYLCLNQVLAKCPAHCQTFVRYYNPNGDDEDAVDRALAEYGGFIKNLDNEDVVAVFSTDEEYVRFILTWN